MKTKDEILLKGEKGIKIAYDSPPFERKMELLKLDVLIDIRDILNQRLTEISGDMYKALSKD